MVRGCLMSEPVSGMALLVFLLSGLSSGAGTKRDLVLPIFRYVRTEGNLYRK